MSIRSRLDSTFIMGSQDGHASYHSVSPCKQRLITVIPGEVISSLRRSLWCCRPCMLDAASLERFLPLFALLQTLTFLRTPFCYFREPTLEFLLCLYKTTFSH